MMFFALQFVRSPKKFNVHLCQKVPFVLACFRASAAPRPKKMHFVLDTQITIVNILQVTVDLSGQSILTLEFEESNSGGINWNHQLFDLNRFSIYA
jgi:hypothetical protein